MKRHFGIVIGLGLLLVVTNAESALAQGPFKPAQTVIVNGTAKPVPVLVTNTRPTPPDLVKCSLYIGGLGSATPVVAGGGGGSSLNAINCPAGVTALDVQRVFFAPGVPAESTVSNVLHWQVVFGLSSDTNLEAGEVMAVLTAGAPDTVLSRPVRFDVTLANPLIAFRESASTGIPGISAAITGSLIFEGVPVP